MYNLILYTGRLKGTVLAHPTQFCTAHFDHNHYMSAPIAKSFYRINSIHWFIAVPKCIPSVQYGNETHWLIARWSVRVLGGWGVVSPRWTGWVPICLLKLVFSNSGLADNCYGAAKIGMARNYGAIKSVFPPPSNPQTEPCHDFGLGIVHNVPCCVHQSYLLVLLYVY